MKQTIMYFERVGDCPHRHQHPDPAFAECLHKDAIQPPVCNPSPAAYPPSECPLEDA